MVPSLFGTIIKGRHNSHRLGWRFFLALPLEFPKIFTPDHLQ